MKVFENIKAHILSNTRFPHPALLGLVIGAAISAITVGIFYLSDSGMFGQDVAEAARGNGRVKTN